MSDLRSRVPAQSVMERTLELHPRGFYAPSGDALSWYKGALGELAVAGVLSWLGPEWTVLHSVPVGSAGRDIDHVVIGPSGVFTLNTKSHVGQKVWMAGYGLLVNGKSTRYIPKAIAEANEVAELLSVASGLTVQVTPVIVFVNPGPRTVKSAVAADVRVVADWELLLVICGRRIFSDEQVTRIADAAIRPASWGLKALPKVDTRSLFIEFSSIMARGHQGARTAPTYSAVPAAPVSTVPLVRAPTPSPRLAPHPVSRRRSRAPRSTVGGLLTRLGLVAGGVWLWVDLVLPALRAAATP